MRFLYAFVLACLPALVGAQTPLSLLDLKTELNATDDTLRVVNFWATWCKPCVEELPYFVEAGEANRTAKVKVLLVAVEDKIERVAAFARNRKGNFYVLTEKDANVWIPQIDNQWEGEIPATLLVNAAQRIRVFHAKAFTREQLTKFLAPYLKKN